jgi:hypothetical protein
MSVRNAGPLPHSSLPLSNGFAMVTETGTCQWRKSVTEFVSSIASVRTACSRIPQFCKGFVGSFLRRNTVFIWQATCCVDDALEIRSEEARALL